MKNEKDKIETLEMEKCMKCGNATFMVQLTIEDGIPVNAQLICVKCGNSSIGYNLVGSIEHNLGD